MIKKIYLENWKSHEKSVIEFGKINLIIGRLGSGKTSITDAISYALLGNFSDLNSRKIKLEDIIMKKPKEKDFAKIVLNFSLNEKNYEIIRIIEKNKGSYSELKEDNKIIRSGTTDVNEFLQKLLKIDFQTFINVIYAEQNKLEFFLNLERGERKARFDEMIGVEKLERIRKTCVSVKNRLIDIHREKERFLSQLISENLDKKIEEIKNEIEKIEEKNKELEKIKVDLENTINELRKKVEIGKNIEKEINNLEKEIIDKKAKIDKISNLIEELLKEIKYFNKEDLEKEIDKIKIYLIEIEKKLLKLEEDLIKLEREKEEKYKSLVVIKQKFERKEKIEKKLLEFNNIEILLNEIEKREKEKKEMLEKILDKQKEIENEIKKEEKLVDILEEEFSICPICEREIDKDKKDLLREKHKNLIENLLKELSKIKDEIEKIKNEIKSIEEEKRNILLKFSEKKNLEKELETLSNVNYSLIENLEKEILEKEDKIKTIKEEFEKTKDEKHKKEVAKKEIEYNLEKFEKVNKLKKELEILENDLEYLRNRLKNLVEIEEYKNLKNYENVLKEYELKFENTKLEIENNKKLLNVLSQRKKEIEDRISLRERIKSEKNYLERVIKDLNILEISTKEAQLIVRNKLIDAINYYLSLYWKKIYPYRDYVDARFIATEDDYILQIKDSLGRWIELDKVASGGERTLAAICLRIAFSKVLSPILNIIIFDEPTHNLDEEAITQFARIINENFSEIFDQVFIITHDERFKSIINANIIRVERNKFEDLPSKVIIE